MVNRPFTPEMIVSESQKLKFKGYNIFPPGKPIEFKGKLGCSEFFNNLFQTLPPVWEPKFLGFSFDFLKKVLYLEASVLNAGKIKYPLHIKVTQEDSKIIFELQ